ncbi:pentatricopeptide repeat-containing protein At3g22690-like [Papaver somniferum]|uniref:pentatricopeptide repeat-containing protein At3g22690-like n=1 Tax=Papaver somniferum TaxID=3469 RepID=UPI000E6FC00F|nr:pentatricopeptide repeat-containing protein At3g22690-like [Papaver somniferum]XP_026446552.1 pentatricopeptide repeat-containing protein At3g22690-like [Papaver somniferum]XP_026446553.1 pentatricopeptide repeat-containing protein At3g22690-like [Papaver somniferum]XP_026446554.1 pentatricopeptide repeat-containing protein At3g22690-like [Papaver somniferum]XP_026446555.1 pentatricopeptide repeat-containing protein At3g22690-like [Papaver somniferum]
MIAATSFSSNFPPPQKKPTTLTNTSTSLNYNTQFISLLLNCSSLQELHQLHAQFVKTGAINDSVLLTRLISLCSLLDFSNVEYIHRILFSVSNGNRIIWNSIFQEFSVSSVPEQSLLLFIKMIEGDKSSSVNSHVIPSILKACSRIMGASEGIQIHGICVKLNTMADSYVQNAMIQMYSKCGQLFEARQVFDKMPDKNVVSWNSIITCYAELGRWEDVKILFWLMVEESFLIPNSITLVKMISACTKSGDFEAGKWVHQYILENGIRVCLNLGNTLMNMYAKMGEMNEARRLFDQMWEQDVVSWTTLVSGYAGSGSLDVAREFFDRIPNRNVIAWNAMFAGYVSNGCFLEAVLLFRDMLVFSENPDRATILSVLAACVGLEDIFTARTIHGFVCKGGIDWTVDLVNCFIRMYTKCGSMYSAELLFKRMHMKNEITFTTMIVGYVQCGAEEVALEIFYKMPYKDIISWNALLAVLNQCSYFNEALSIFLDMLRANVRPNKLTLVSMLSACANAGAFDLGQWIHAYIDRNNIETDNHLLSSLIDMYAKCGSIEIAVELFAKVQNKDLLIWSIMIRGLAMNGHGNLALDLFEEMLQFGVEPDSITFIGVLSACSHAGLVDKGRHYFDMMTRLYKISPEAEHYSCMVDIFGRRGLLLEAKDFIEDIPRNCNEKAIWGALLGACRIHGNVELAKYAANHLLELDPNSSGGYVLLSNIYAETSNWNDVVEVRKLMKMKGVAKLPGCSCIELNGVVQEFFAGDISHPQCEQIYRILEELERHMGSTDSEYEYYSLDRLLCPQRCLKNWD